MHLDSGAYMLTFLFNTFVQYRFFFFFVVVIHQGLKYLIFVRKLISLFRRMNSLGWRALIPLNMRLRSKREPKENEMFETCAIKLI